MKLIYHPLVVVVITLSAGLFYWSLLRSERQIKLSSQTVVDLEQEVTRADERVRQLEQEVALTTTSAIQEQIIRDELLMKKPGEFVVQLPDLTQTNQQPGEISSGPNQPLQEWWQLLRIGY